MVDCGARLRDGRYWSPSLHFGGQRIDVLALLNLDEDHICNFGFMLTGTKIGHILSNPTVGVDELRSIKKDGMGPGAQAFASWMTHPFKAAPMPVPDFGPVRIWWYYNRFVRGMVNETNNLSLVLFVEYAGFKLVFSGDMEKTGWHYMLRSPAFRASLFGTNIFVASHHGRRNGQCAELFEWFRPEIIIISDDDKQYDSQETGDWYAQRCMGAVVVADPTQRRYVMTTRRDGSMQIDVKPDGSWTLRPIQVADWPVTPPQRSQPTSGIGLLSQFGLGYDSASSGFGLGLGKRFLQPRTGES